MQTVAHANNEINDIEKEVRSVTLSIFRLLPPNSFPGLSFFCFVLAFLFTGVIAVGLLVCCYCGSCRRQPLASHCRLGMAELLGTLSDVATLNLNFNDRHSKNTTASAPPYLSKFGNAILTRGYACLVVVTLKRGE
jgi:hypothetical protein